MPVVEMNGCEGECVICLEEWKSEETVKEMPCKHRFHGGCVEKWLGFHGSCPVCRDEMHVDGDEVGKKRNDGGEVWVRFSFNDGRRELEILLVKTMEAVMVMVTLLDLVAQFSPRFRVTEAFL
ncbi:PREDICTED: E3 ubiquitin-protein ligase RNF181-like [Camelina sativa]|uniref:E3 ubiquitin-protein ligase RNF181-like n=1 Tax=Camelina sativa TaxID=90675 RepID=A0ABM0X4S0_CAMSA|nr:PREDICTED: E3 ubiquitin-protein ligase RNF181-like [Camelina sativa]